MKQKTILSGMILFLFTIITVSGQSFSKNSIKLGSGLGFSLSDEFVGSGIYYTIGYQREIWRDRLRFNPNFSIGSYSTLFVQDAPDEYFNSINLESNFFFDLLKAKSFSLVVGTGGFLNNSKGLIGSGGDLSGNSQNNSSRYSSAFYYGIHLSGGFRINPSNKRLAVNILPITVHIGNKEFAEISTKIEFDLKF